MQILTCIAQERRLFRLYSFVFGFEIESLPPGNAREGNVFSHVCYSVSFSVPREEGSFVATTHAALPWCPPSSGPDPPLEIFKIVQLGPYCLWTPLPLCMN